MGSNKGGRPKAKVKRAKQITVVCNMLEFKSISFKALSANVSKSEYLRVLGINGDVVFKVNTMPKEILRLTAELNQTNSLLNQIAHKRNKNDILSLEDRLHLKELIIRVQSVVDIINQEKRND